MALGLIAGAALNGMIGAVQGQKQYNREIDKMNYQYKLNAEAAKQSQTLAKDMWDYTNYENTVEHMKNAGLSVGLLYGTGGGQGQSTTTGGRQEGVDMGTTQAGGISLQGASILADIKLKEAEAEKAEAEAKKTAGADTKYTESLTSLNTTIEELNKATTALRTAEAGKAQEETKQILQSIENMQEQLRGMIADNDIKVETKEEKIQQAWWDMRNAMGTAMVKEAQIGLTRSQKELVDKEVNYFVYRIVTDRIKANAAEKTADASMQGAEAQEKSAKARWLDAETNQQKARVFADEVKAKIEYMGERIDIEKERILQDWIYKSINAGVQIGDLISTFTPQGAATKTVKSIFGQKKPKQYDTPTGGKPWWEADEYKGR